MDLIYVFGLFDAFRLPRLWPGPLDRRCICPRPGPCAWRRRCETILINIPKGSAPILREHRACNRLCQDDKPLCCAPWLIARCRKSGPVGQNSSGVNPGTTYFMGMRSNFQRMESSAAAKRRLPAALEVRTARPPVAASLGISLSFPIHGGKIFYARNSQQEYRKKFQVLFPEEGAV